MSNVKLILERELGDDFATDEQIASMTDEEIIELAMEDVVELVDGAKWTVVRE